MVMILCLKMLPTHRKSDSPFSVSYRTLSALETPKLKKVWRNKKMKPKGHGNTHSLTLPRDSIRDSFSRAVLLLIQSHTNSNILSCFHLFFSCDRQINSIPKKVATHYNIMPSYWDYFWLVQQQTILLISEEFVRLKNNTSKNMVLVIELEIIPW